MAELKEIKYLIGDIKSLYIMKGIFFIFKWKTKIKYDYL